MTMKVGCIPLLLALLAPVSASACSACEDEVCIFTACLCVPNALRCPPRIEPGNSTLYCIIGSKPTDTQGKSSCTNCKSQLSGDAGKADCLLRHQGDHVNDGECSASGCYEVR